MTEEAKKIVEAIKEAFEVLSAMELPTEEQKIEITRDSAMTLIAELEQVTRERDALLDELKGECDVCANRKDCTAPKCRRSTHKECDECPCRTCIIDTNWKWEGVEATNDAQKGSDAKS